MAGIRKLKTCIVIVMIFVFQYVLAEMYCKEHAYTELLNVMFLNFEEIHNYQLNRFCIEFLIPFVFLFYVFYNSQIEFLNVNTSFLTMYMNRRSKKETVKEILQKTGIDQMIYLCVCAGMSIGLLSVDMCFFKRKEEWINILIFLIYIFRYLLFLYFSINCLRMTALKKEIHYEVMIPYGIFIEMLVFDGIAGTHLITYSNQLKIECLYLIGYMVSGMIVEITMILKFRKGDFV